MLKVLFKLNLVPCRESSYTTKNKYPENYLHIIFNTKRKRKGAVGGRGDDLVSQFVCKLSMSI